MTSKRSPFKSRSASNQFIDLESSVNLNRKCVQERMDEFLEKIEDEKRERDLDLAEGNLPYDFKVLHDTLNSSFKKERKKFNVKISEMKTEIAELKKLINGMGSAAPAAAINSSRSEGSNRQNQSKLFEFNQFEDWN